MALRFTSPIRVTAYAAPTRKSFRFVLKSFRKINTVSEMAPQNFPVLFFLCFISCLCAGNLVFVFWFLFCCFFYFLLIVSNSIFVCFFLFFMYALVSHLLCLVVLFLHICFVLRIYFLCLFWLFWSQRFGHALKNKIIVVYLRLASGGGGQKKTKQLWFANLHQKTGQPPTLT